MRIWEMIQLIKTTRREWLDVGHLCKAADNMIVVKLLMIYVLTKCFHQRAGIKKMKYFIVMLVVFSQNVFSCSCDKDYDAAKSHEEADAIFIGEVVSKGRFYSFTENQFKYRYVNFYKGEGATEIKIITEKSSTACGLRYEKGKRYVIYAYRDKENSAQLRTSKCSSWLISDQSKKRTEKFFEFYTRDSMKKI